MICPTCNQTIQETEPQPVTNWLPVWIGGVEYTAVDWGVIKQRRFNFDGKAHYSLSIPLLFVEIERIEQ